MQRQSHERRRNVARQVRPGRPVGHVDVHRPCRDEQTGEPAVQIDHGQQAPLVQHVHHTLFDQAQVLDQASTQRELAAQRPQPGLKTLQALTNAGFVIGIEELGRCKTVGQGGGKGQRAVHLGAVEHQALTAAVRVVDQDAVAPLHLNPRPMDHPGVGQMRVTAAPFGPPGLHLGRPGLQTSGRRRVEPQQTQIQNRLLHKGSRGFRRPTRQASKDGFRAIQLAHVGG